MENLAAPLLEAISSIASCFAREMNLCWNSEQRECSLTVALNELKDKREELEREIREAEFKGLRCTKQVQRWIERVRILESKASSIIESLKERQRCLGSCNVNCRSVYMNSKRMEKILAEIKDLEQKGDFSVVCVEETEHKPVEEIPAKPTIGLDLMTAQVFECLEKDDMGIIGIYGMGGVGKTTLLKKINNELLTKTHQYHIVIWVSVSKESAVDSIQQAIQARLGLSWEENENHAPRSSRIYSALRKKRFLLLLDDLRERLDLEKVGVPLPDNSNKCKLMFTTRSMAVCGDMDAHQKLKVEFLGERDSWRLFCEKLGGGEILNSKPIRRYAEKIVKKCGGLPLALITIGRAMSTKESPEEWKHALEVLDKCSYELRGVEEIFSLLKFSYDNLTCIQRSCFLYCSLFPGDYPIEKEQLIQYWVAEGFHGTQDEGHAIIGSLKEACLLENGKEKTHVKMHDVVRSFAIWIASEYGSNKRKFLVEASTGIIQAPQVEDWEATQRISLVDNGITALSEVPISPNLSTLMLQWNSGLSKIADGFFQYMPLLTVLDLSFTSIRELPPSIGMLVQLHHLDLSGTKLATLPKELGNLAKLRYLDLQRSYTLRTIPRESILGLWQLMVLNLYYSYGFWEALDSVDVTEVRFAHLDSLQHLSTLGITITELRTLLKLSNYSGLLRSIQYLYIKGCDGLFQLQLPSTDIVTSERLRRLSIDDCHDLKCISVGDGTGKRWLPNLEVLALYSLPSLSVVWKNPITSDCLQSLRSLNIWYCNKLRNVSWILQLPCLETVYLFYCEAMEEVITAADLQVVQGGQNQSLVTFPSLKTLSIRDLPELKWLAPSKLHFPSLESVAVIGCPQMKKLTIQVQDDIKLPVIYGKKEWWDGLEWDDAITRSTFIPHFMSI